VVKNILFVCIHNSARSQIAEAYIRDFASNRYKAYSAGLEKGELNPVVIEALKLDGIDISDNITNSVNEFIDGHIKFDFIVTVCDETAAERCPYFPGQGQRLHWGFTDPSSLAGSDVEKLERTIEIRDQIKEKIIQFLNE
jgi:arsenate reductase (thioredoxin)